MKVWKSSFTSLRSSEVGPLPRNPTPSHQEDAKAGTTYEPNRLGAVFILMSEVNGKKALHIMVLRYLFTGRPNKLLRRNALIGGRRQICRRDGQR